MAISVDSAPLLALLCSRALEVPGSRLLLGDCSK